MEPSDVISKVTITTDDGKEIRGIIGSKPPHVLEPEARKSLSISKICLLILVLEVKQMLNNTVLKWKYDYTL